MISRIPHFNQRHFGAYHFNGGLPLTEESLDYFEALHLNALHFSGLQHFSALGQVSGIITIPRSIDIQISPSTVPRNNRVTITAFVYDQFNKPLQGVRVNFLSSDSSVISTPSHVFTGPDGTGTQTTLVGSTGTANLFANVENLSAYTSVTVTAAIGGVTSTLTHGATIQMGNAGGGSPGPIKIKFMRQTRRWPTR